MLDIIGRDSISSHAISARILQDESILCFSPNVWDDIWRNRHQIMSVLARHGNKVLFVEPRQHLRPTWERFRRGEFGWRDLGGPHVKEVMPNLWVYRDPHWAPISGRSPLSWMTAYLRRRALLHTMRRLEFGRPILWLFRYNMDDVPGQFGEKLVIYHMVDEYSAYGGAVDPAAVQAREAALLRRVDLVFVTSSGLWQTKRLHQPDTFWVPNGVNFDAFQRALQDPAEPAGLAGLPHPRIGYVGALNEKVALPLIREVALARPDWTFVLVGPLQLAYEPEKADGLAELPNVHFLGKVPVDDVPHYIKACDVCLLPYEQNEWTRHIDSLKLYEYLACGKQVVATGVPTAQEHAEYVCIADDASAFAAAIERALAVADDAKEKERRIRYAARCSWEARVAQMSEHIQQALKLNSR